MNKINKNNFIYQIAELNSTENISDGEVLEILSEAKIENLAKYFSKTEPTVQIESKIFEIFDCLIIKNDTLFDYQNDFISNQNDDFYDFKDEINREIEMGKSSRSSILEDQQEQIKENQMCQSISSFISENELILSEIEKKNEIFHSKNYYHLIDKGDLDQSDDQSNFCRPSEIVKQNYTNKVIATQNHHLSRLSYSSLSLFKNCVSVSSLEEKSDTLIKNDQSLSTETLSEKPSKHSLISVQNPIHFYCLLKYRIKHLLKYK